MKPIRPQIIFPALIAALLSCLAPHARAALAEGGTVTKLTQDGIEYVIHTFTSPGNAELKVISGGKVDVLVVGGGGGGGKAEPNPGGDGAGGGGAGGLIYTSLVVAEGNIQVTVGAGGAGSSVSTARGVNGSDSVFGALIAAGGGGGGSDNHDVTGVNKGADGGSGGGASSMHTDSVSGGSCATGQGKSGGETTIANGRGGAGGGGAGAAGATNPSHAGGAGGAGVTHSISGSPVAYAGGGGGGACSNSGGAGGTGGGGRGGNNGENGTDGTANTGGGGGGGTSNGGNGGNGGSGIVIVRYPKVGVICTPATEVTATSAILHGVPLNSNSGNKPVEVTVYWGHQDGSVTGKWANSHSWPKGQFKGGAALDWPVKDLDPGRTYYYTFRAATDEFDQFAPSPAVFITGSVWIEMQADASETGLTPGTFIVRRQRSAVRGPLTVSYTVSGTATNGVDYRALPGTLTIPAGADSATLTVTPIRDYLAEPAETVVVTLAKGPYLVGEPAQASLMLADNGALLFSPTAAPTMPPEAAVLCGVLQSRCNGSAEAFSAFYGVAGAYDCLADQVRRSMLSTDLAVVARAVAYGAPFTPLASGLHATFFEGANHEKAILERREGAVRIEAGKFPHPKGRQQNVSALWTGFLDVPRAGDYRFFVDKEGSTFRLTIANRVIMSHDGNAEWSQVTKLEPGLHPFHATFQLGTTGIARCELTWEGPGFGRSPLGGGVLRTPLPLEEALAVAKVMPALAGADVKADTAARQAIHTTDPASRTFLINALYNGPDAQVRAAVDMLVYRLEPGLTEHLTAMLDKRQEFRSDWIIMDGLVQTVRQAPDKLLAAMAAQLKEKVNDQEVTMDAGPALLCAALQLRCNNDRAAFGKLTGDPEAGARLEAYVGRALASAKPEVLARACRYGTPFVRAPRGWTARYYEGRDPLRSVSESRTWAAAVNGNFPLPPECKGEVSATWSGLFQVPSTNKYLLRLGASEHGRLWFDGRLALECVNNEQSMNIENAKGLHDVRVAFDRGSGTPGLFTHWEGPELPRQDLVGWWVSSPLTVNELAAIQKALADLAKPETAPAASAQFVGDDDGRRAFLRSALRHHTAAAAQALEMLTAMRDAPAIALVLEQLGADTTHLPKGTLLAALERLAVHLDDKACAWLAGRTKLEDTPENRPWLAVLYAILERKCDGKADVFAKLTGQAEAHAALTRLAGQMLTSGNSETVDWACEHAGPFAPFIGGCRGRFYDGQAFGRLVTEQRPPSPRFDNGQFPSRAQTNVSAVWHGRLWVEKLGEYTFFLRADDGQRLWLDGKVVLDAWLYLTSQEISAKVTLDRGWHEIEAVAWQGEGPGGADITWQGPDLGRQRLDGRMQAHPLAADMAALRKHVQDLGAANATTVEQARKAVAEYGELGKLFLRNAAQHATGAVKEQAAKLVKASP